MNVIRFKKMPENPVIARTPGTFYSKYVANPDVIRFRDHYFLYFRGQDEHGHDQIGLGCCSAAAFDGVHWIIPDQNPVIRVSEHPDAFDTGHILDPAALEINSRIYLYYTAHHRNWRSWNMPSHIGLAISEDGYHFEKVSQPIVDGMAPEVVFYQGGIFLFYQRLNRSKSFDVFCSASTDGITFAQTGERQVFNASGQEGAFDSFSISTVRIWQEDDLFFMTFGGCNRFTDYPVAIGLARSQDLYHWERYPGNPILERGELGTWDEGALWFATVYKNQEIYYLWYEGTGTGLSQNNDQAISASHDCRQKDYGGYGVTSFSQIGLAHLNARTLNW